MVKVDIPPSPRNGSLPPSPRNVRDPVSPRNTSAVRPVNVILLMFLMAAFVALATTLIVMGKMPGCAMLSVPITPFQEHLFGAPHDNTGMTSHGLSSEQEYMFALATMRCLTTPHCFPRTECRTGTPMKIKRGAKFEEQAFCVDDLRAVQDNCLVYSFGIYYAKVQWESKVAKFFGCEVHAFDPTMDHPTNLAPGVTFHKLGLQGEGTNMSATTSKQYKPIDPARLLQLGEIMEKLGHQNRSLDVLMLDCEGCEWGVLKQMACGGDSVRVKQIVAEFHFQKNLGLYDESDVLNAAQGVMCLWKERWNIVSIESSTAATNDWDYARGMVEVIHSAGMLLYIAFQRIPEEESLVSELRGSYVDSTKQLSVLIDGTRDKYGKNKDKWPNKSKIASERRANKEARMAMAKAEVKKVTLDEYPRLDEEEFEGTG